jgi:selenocysteine-specific elongation factor
VIVGTAGHIDHGKSTLVAALTGRPVDRLAEERRRGITIELGFAPFILPDGRVAGVIDVPGHEDFVRTMVAGASGIDLALLVVAADEGIRPQTEEHLLILEQLGIRTGIPVLTKIDLVEAEWLELVAADLAERLAASPVAFARSSRVSARTGAGVDQLRSLLGDTLLDLPPRRRGDLFRVPVDRVFSLAGVGTVVTGTCWSGRADVGEAVRLLPSGVEARVRSAESFGVVAAAESGARVALGLAGIDRSDAARGDLVVSARDAWLPSSAIDVRVGLHSSAPRAIGRRTRVRINLATGEAIGWLSPRSTIAPGGFGVARISVDRPVVARGGDRFVVRSFSPVTTIGGGEVLDPAPPPRGAVWPDGLASGNIAIRLTALIERRRYGASAAELPILTGLPPAEAESAAAGNSQLVRVGGHWVSAGLLSRVTTRAVELVARHHVRKPAEAGVQLETLRQELKVPSWLGGAALECAAGNGRIVIEQSIVHARDFQPSASTEDAVAGVVSALSRAGLAPPTAAELAAQLGVKDLGMILRAAVKAGSIEAVERDRFYARDALDGFIAVLAEAGPGGEIVVGALRDRVGVSRKYLIPLLEWADARGITVRIGEVRRFRGARRVV